MKLARFTKEFLSKMDSGLSVNTVKYPLILEGQINQDVLELVDLDSLWLDGKLKQQGLELKDIYIGEYISGELIAHLYQK
nr:YetF domain-containing protein [uncultured Vagococcus sp.]